MKHLNVKIALPGKKNMCPAPETNIYKTDQLTWMGRVFSGNNQEEDYPEISPLHVRYLRAFFSMKYKTTLCKISWM